MIKMDKATVTTLCLLVYYIPSVLNLPVVPKPVQNVGQTGTDISNRAQGIILGKEGGSVHAKVVQFVKPSLHSGNNAQILPLLPKTLESKQEEVPNKQDIVVESLSSHRPSISKRKDTSSSLSSRVNKPFNTRHPKKSKNLKFGAASQNTGMLEYIEPSPTPVNQVIQDSAEFKIASDNPVSLQLSVNSDLQTKGEGHTEASEMLLTIGTGLAALFSLGLVIGMFSCCCPKKPRSDDVELKGERLLNDDQNNEKPLSETQKPSQVFNNR